MTDDPLLHPDTIRDCSGAETGQYQGIIPTMQGLRGMPMPTAYPAVRTGEPDRFPLSQHPGAGRDTLFDKLSRIESKLDTLLHHFALESK